jgi:hypothetical protein
MALIKLNNRGVRNVSTFGSVGGGSITFIKKLTASSDDTISFVDGTSDVVLDSTYKEYLFTFNNIHPETDNTEFSFQGNAAGGSGYNETITSTFFQAYNAEDDSGTSLSYQTGDDLAQGTGFQNLVGDGVDNANDENVSGYLHLFDPSSTTFVKHFFGTSNSSITGYSTNGFFAGYFNTTSAIDEIQFKMSSGDIDAGTIKLYGVS